LTAATAYQIYTKQHLEELSDSITSSPSNNATTAYNWSRGKYFKVMNDIPNPITRIIGGQSASTSFQGHFDGQGYTITVYIDATTLPNNIISIGLKM